MGDPELELLMRELKAEREMIMKRAFDRATPRQREAFSLRLDGGQFKDIAEQMGVTAPRVMQLVNAMKRRIQIEFEKHKRYERHMKLDR